MVHAARPRPDAIIIDVSAGSAPECQREHNSNTAQLFAVHPFRSIKAVSGDSIKIHVWHPALTYEMFWFWGPEKVGGRGNLRVKAEEEARLTGQSYTDVVKKVCFASILTTRPRLMIAKQDFMGRKGRRRADPRISASV